MLATLAEVIPAGEEFDSNVRSYVPQLAIAKTTICPARRRAIQHRTVWSLYGT